MTDRPLSPALSPLVSRGARAKGLRTSARHVAPKPCAGGRPSVASSRSTSVKPLALPEASDRVFRRAGNTGRLRDESNR